MGGLLIREWALPSWVETVARYHHDYQNAPQHQTEAMVTCLADNLAHWAMKSSKDVTEEELFELSVVEDLDLYEENVRSLLDGRDQAVESAMAFV
jgi:HD-like signal output (HDOD) protein